MDCIRNNFSIMFHSHYLPNDRCVFSENFACLYYLYYKFASEFRMNVLELNDHPDSMGLFQCYIYIEN